MNIQITTEIIQKSKKDKECPIYRAIRNAIHRPVIIGNNSGTYLTSSGKRKIFTLPSEARTFISKWDENKKVEPISFKI